MLRPSQGTPVAGTAFLIMPRQRALARALKLPAVPVVLMIGFGANFMGIALIIGDLPPQMTFVFSLFNFHIINAIIKTS